MLIDYKTSRFFTIFFDIMFCFRYQFFLQVKKDILQGRYVMCITLEKNYFIARKFQDIKHLQFRGCVKKTAKLKCTKKSGLLTHFQNLHKNY